jgi:hypothetical protein
MDTAIFRVSEFTANSFIYCCLIFNIIKRTCSQKSLRTRGEYDRQRICASMRVMASIRASLRGTKQSHLYTHNIPHLQIILKNHKTNTIIQRKKKQKTHTINNQIASCLAMTQPDQIKIQQFTQICHW